MWLSNKTFSLWHQGLILQKVYIFRSMLHLHFIPFLPIQCHSYQFHYYLTSVPFRPISSPSFTFQPILFIHFTVHSVYQFHSIPILCRNRILLSQCNNSAMCILSETVYISRTGLEACIRFLSMYWNVAQVQFWYDFYYLYVHVSECIFSKLVLYIIMYS